ncbi:MAG: carbon storage regulator [Spirochaetaceae bacterium]|nr:carbon storage regulator [Spirochaetaceae bacterium]
MLVLGRREGEALEINFHGEIIRIVLVGVPAGGLVRVGVDAARDVQVRRAELARGSA